MGRRNEGNAYRMCAQHFPKLRVRLGDPPSQWFCILANSSWTSARLGHCSSFWDFLPTWVAVCTLHVISEDLVGLTPVSPPVRRHLLGTGQREEAERVVALLNGVPKDHVLVSEIIEELDYGIRAENEGGKATWMECFSSRSDMWKRTGNGMMLQFIQQLNGQNFYCEYSDKMFNFSEIWSCAFRLLWWHVLPECWYPVSQKRLSPRTFAVSHNFS